MLVRRCSSLAGVVAVGALPAAHAAPARGRAVVRAARRVHRDRPGPRRGGQPARRCSPPSPTGDVRPARGDRRRRRVDRRHRGDRRAPTGRPSCDPARRRPVGWASRGPAPPAPRAASRDLLVFLDADVRLAPAAARERCSPRTSAVGGLVSVQPHHRPGRRSRSCRPCSTSAPSPAPAAAAPGTARGRLRPVPRRRPGRPRADRRARRGGRFGDRGRRPRPAARAVTASPVSTFRGGDLVTFRMYPDGWRALIDGWTKNIARGAGAAPWWARGRHRRSWVAGLGAIAVRLAARRRGRRSWPTPSPSLSCALGASAASAGSAGGRPRASPCRWRCSSACSSARCSPWSPAARSRGAAGAWSTTTARHRTAMSADRRPAT